MEVTKETHLQQDGVLTHGVDHVNNYHLIVQKTIK